MEVRQIYELTNQIAQELLGEEVVVQEDLSNVVELGEQFENVAGLDNYVRSLNDHVGRLIVVDRVYSGRAPSVFMDGWEFGSVLEKISADLPQAEENETWELTGGEVYEQDTFYKPVVTASFWNKRTTFEVPISITERQVKSAFSSVTQLNAFISMIYTAIANAMTLRMDALIMRTINNMAGETIANEYTGSSGPIALNTKSGVRAVNLLYLYNHRPGAPVDEDGDLTDPLTAEQALTDPGFIRFASLTMKNYVDYMGVMSTRFNVYGKERFTPSDRLHWVALSAFINAADVYLQSDTFHDDYTRLPNAETVPFWQGSGEDFGLASTGTINIKTASGNEVKATGVLAVMFDTFALGVTNMDRRVTTHYNAKAEFWNEFHKFDAGYFNDLAENFVVFFVA